MSEITAAIAWNDQLLNHHPEMDATHREFVDHLAQVQAALAGPQDALLARYDAMLEHTVEHFAQEAHIEGNQQRGAVDGGIDHHLGGPSLLGACGYL